MFVEESIWIGEALDGIALEPGMAVLDAGSSTPEFHAEQPHVGANVLDPLVARGLEMFNLDIRSAPGIDYVCDLTAPDFEWETSVGRRFNLVLCNNLLPHVADPRAAAASVTSLVEPGGWLLATTPAAYRRVRNPFDNGLRPDPGALAALLRESAPGGLEAVRRAELRIDQRDYYRWSLRPSWLRLGGGWIPVPGLVEQLRYVWPRLRWRVSCVLLRRAA